MSFWMKRHHNDEGVVLASCDHDVLGERFSEGKQVLDVKESFYKGEEVELEDIVAAMEGITTTNFVGEDLISQLIEYEIVDEDSVKTVDGVPHSQVVYL